MTNNNLHELGLSMKNIIRKEIEAGRYMSLDLPNNIEDIGIYRCICCEANLSGYVSAVAHATGKKHFKRVGLMSLVEPVDCLISQFSHFSTSEHTQESSSSSSSSSSREGSLERRVSVSPVNIMNISIEEAVKRHHLHSEGNGYICSICDNLPLTSNIVAKQHIDGSKHLKKLIRKPSDNFETLFDALQSSIPNRKIADSPPLADISKKNLEDQPFYCKCCDKTLNSESQYEAHNTGSSHMKKMAQKSITLVNDVSTKEFSTINLPTRTNFDDNIIIISAHDILMDHPCFSD